MSRGFSAKYNRDIKRLDVKGQYWTRKDAETMLYMLKNFNGLHTHFDCVIDLTDCDVDNIRLEKFIEVALEQGLRYVVIVVGNKLTQDWLRDGYPIEKKERFSQAESYIGRMIDEREQKERKAKARERIRLERMERLNGNNL